MCRRVRSCPRTSLAMCRTRPYTAGSNHTTWTAPDILKAKQLVKESGTAGMKVVVNSGNDDASMAFAVQMASDLRGSAIR